MSSQWAPLPRQMKSDDFAQWLASTLEREGWTSAVKRELEDWIYQKTGRTVIPRSAA